MNIHEKLPTDLKAIPALIRDVAAKLRELPIDKGQLHDVRLCLEEALVNAIKHGNKFNPNLFVEVDIESDGNSLSISVADQGEGFDFQGIPDPRNPDNLHKLSGRGILLIRSHMDSVDFFDSGRTIKMTKLFKGRGK